MRGGLDEALARMARREEALRRRATDPVDPEHGPAGGPEPDGTGAATVRPGAGDTRRPAEPEAAARRPDDPAPGSHAGPGDPVTEVAEALRRVVAGRPGLAVSVRVEHDGQAYPLRVVWSDGRVTVSAEPAVVPPPGWPLPVRTVPARAGGAEDPTGDLAARLAEIIRRDPSLLHGDRPG